jgi:hypothetical protein
MVLDRSLSGTARRFGCSSLYTEAQLPPQLPRTARSLSAALWRSALLKNYKTENFLRCAHVEQPLEIAHGSEAVCINWWAPMV